MSDIYQWIETANFSEVAATLRHHSLQDPSTIEMYYSAIEDSPLSTDPISLDSIHTHLNRYESASGDLRLRRLICDFYKKHCDFDIDPETEIILTSGSVGALTVAILSLTEAGDSVAITNPTYMAYEETLKLLSRNPFKVRRDNGQNQYTKLESNAAPFRSMIINSPENPTGYTLTTDDWNAIISMTQQHGVTVIHDEVFGVFDFDGGHKPAVMIPELKESAVVVNSFSKMFALPSLKLGWMIAPKAIIDKARKINYYCYLGVNSLSEHIACHVLERDSTAEWLKHKQQLLQARRDYLTHALTQDAGYEWLYYPNGGHSMTPTVRLLYNKIPQTYKSTGLSMGSAVAKYLYYEKGISVAPGCVFGSQLRDCIKLTTAKSEANFLEGISRLT